MIHIAIPSYFSGGYIYIFVGNNKLALTEIRLPVTIELELKMELERIYLPFFIELALQVGKDVSA